MVKTATVPEDWIKADVTPAFKKGKKDPGNYWPVTLTSISGKVMEKLILEAISKHMEDKVITSSQHGFTREKSYLTNLIASTTGQVAGLMRREQQMLSMWPSARLSTLISHDILIGKLRKCRLDE